MVSKAERPEIQDKGKPNEMVLGQPVLKISAPGGPRRRAGMRFDQTPVTVNPATLTQEQLAALRADQKLRIEGDIALTEEAASE